MAATHPPLGQVSLVKTRHVAFTVVIQVPSSKTHEPWEAVLWHSIDSGEWSEAQASRQSHEEEPVSLQRDSSPTTPLYFSVNITVNALCAFTLRFRPGQNEPWRWVRDEAGLADGTVIVQASSADSSDDIRDVMKYLSPDWKAVSQQSQAPRTRLWSVHASIAGAQGENSTLETLPLGIPWERTLKLDHTRARGVSLANRAQMVLSCPGISGLDSPCPRKHRD